MAFDPNEFQPMTEAAPPMVATPSQKVVSQEAPAQQPQLPQQAAALSQPQPPADAGIPPSRSSAVPFVGGQQQDQQQSFDAGEFASSKALPKYADGSSPLTAVNSSPLGIEERYKLGLGNDKGREEYLKNRFEAVSKDEHGNFVVRDNGLWHRVKGDTFGDADAWTVTAGLVKSAGAAALLGIAPDAAKHLAESNPVSKEIISRYGENIFAPITATLQASPAGKMPVVAGAIAGATAYARTSLGRLEGTYVASPEEQLKDAGIESILNWGGAKVLAGQFPGGAWVGKQLGSVAASLKSLPAESLDLIKNTYGKITVGVDNFDHMLAFPEAVSNVMKTAKGAFSKETSTYVDHITNMSIQEVKKMAGSAQAMMSDVYNGLKNTMTSMVGDEFKSELKSVTSGVFKKGVEDGYLTIRHEGKLLNPTEAAALIAENGGKLPEAAQPVLRKLADMKAAAQAAGDPRMVDEATHGHMSDFFKQVFDMHNTKPLQGKAGFEQLMRLSKGLDDLTFKVGMQANETGLTALARDMASYHENIISKSVGETLEKQGLGAAFKQMQATYSSMKTQLSPLLAAQKLAMTKGDKAFESVLGHVSARAGKNVAQKEGINAAIATAEANGSKVAQVFRDAQFSIRTNQAAIAFNPLVKPGQLTAAGLGAGVGAAALGHPGYLGIAVTGAAATSPRLAGGVAQLANVLGQGQSFLSRLSPPLLKEFTSNPALVRSFIGTLSRMPEVQDKVKDTAIGHAYQQVKGVVTGQPQQAPPNGQ